MPFLLISKFKRYHTTVFFLMLLLLQCNKTTTSKQGIDDEIVELDPGYKTADLSNALNQMNDSSLVSYRIVKESARPQVDIAMYVIGQLGSLKYDYNKRIAEIGSFSGTVIINFQILSSGEVVSVETNHTSITDTVFVENLKKRIKSWNFGAIKEKNETTEIVYPFVFAY